MFIQTAARPTIIAIIEIARISPGQPISLTNIGKNTGVSVSYLEVLFQKLLAVGLVESARGRKGGYSITRSLHEISVGQVIKAVSEVEQASMSEKLGHELWELVEEKIMEWCMDIKLEDVAKGSGVLFR